MSLVQMTTIVMAIEAAVMAILVLSIVAVGTTFAVTTDVSTLVGGNDNSSVVARDGSSGNGENAKSGINTTVCGPGEHMHAKRLLLMNNSII